MPDWANNIQYEKNIDFVAALFADRQIARDYSS